MADKIRFDWGFCFQRRQLGRSYQNHLLDIRAMSSYAGSVSGNSAPSRIWLPLLRSSLRAFALLQASCPANCWKCCCFLPSPVLEFTCLSRESTWTHLQAALTRSARPQA